MNSLSKSIRGAWVPARAWVAASPSLLLALAACQSGPPPLNTDLAQAQSAVAQARSNPEVARNDAADLERAQQALGRAETAWDKHRDVDETRHLSYLAGKRAEIAQSVSAQAQADEGLRRAGAERDRMLLEARTREADQAARRAKAAQADANTAQASAQSAQSAAEQARQQAAREAERAAALEHDLQSLRARETERGVVVTLGDVLFTSGDSTLQPGAYRTVERLAAVMNQHPERRVLIEGYTDNVGPEALNLELSQRRAEAFRRALVASGVAPERIEVRGRGEADPVADNSTAAGRQQNRRVEVVFSDGQGRFAQL